MSKTTSLIPSAAELRAFMQEYARQLCDEWKREIGTRLLELEFEGFISRKEISVSDAAYRLPNAQLRYALGLLEEELEKLGYDYEFRFEDVDSADWVLCYSVTLPEDESEESDETEESEERGCIELIERARNIPLHSSDDDDTEETEALKNDDDVDFAY